MTTVEDIRRWLKEGKQNKKRWLIVVCDTFSHEDYPVYASDSEEFWKEYNSHNGTNMQRIMETYDINSDWEKQLKQTRSHERPK